VKKQQNFVVHYAMNFFFGAVKNVGFSDVLINVQNAVFKGPKGILGACFAP
jgi:hypothetical protein